MAKSRSLLSRKSAAKKAAKTRKSRTAAKKAAKTRKQRAAGKKAAVTRKQAEGCGQEGRGDPQDESACGYRSDGTTTELDNRIAIVRDNLRELVEQAASYSGASTKNGCRNASPNRRRNSRS